jgi:hypothetical protein
MSARLGRVGWLVMTITACGETGQQPLAPDPASGGVAVQAGPPPAGSNKLPTVTITTPSTGAVVPAGSTVQLSADLTDPDLADTHTCTVDWQLAAGPGTVTESNGAGTCTASNLYTAEGSYQIIVAVIDPMGGTAMDSIGITVAAAPPPPPPAPPSTGAIRGHGMLPPGTTSIAGHAGAELVTAFEVNARFSKETGELRGSAVIAVPKAKFTVAASEITDLRITGDRAEVAGSGKLNGRRRVWFAITAIDGRREGQRNGADRIRIRISDERGVVFDTDPGLPAGADPLAVPRSGQIEIRP